MKLPEEDPSMGRIYDVLCRLGVSANYAGFFYIAYGVWLGIRQPERFLLVTKWLYPDVAAHYDTNWRAVERDLRTVVAVVWRSNPALLEKLAGVHLHEKPRPSEFLTILAKAVSPPDTAKEIW